MARRTREEIIEGNYEYGLASRAAQEFNRAEMRRVNEQADALDEAAKRDALERFAREVAQADKRQFADHSDAVRKAAVAQGIAFQEAASERERVQRDLARSIAHSESDLNEKIKQAFGDRLRLGRGAAGVERAAMEEALTAVAAKWGEERALLKERAKDWARSGEVVAAAEKSLAAFARARERLSPAGAVAASFQDACRQMADEAARASEAARTDLVKMHAAAAAIVATAVQRPTPEVTQLVTDPSPAQASAGAPDGRAGAGVDAPRRAGNLASLVAAALGPNAGGMQARPKRDLAARPEVAELVARLVKVERSPTIPAHLEAVPQALPEVGGHDPAQPLRLLSVPAQLERESGPLAGRVGFDGPRPEATPRRGEPEWRREIETWLLKEAGASRASIEAAVKRSAGERVGSDSYGARDPRLELRAEWIRALAAAQRPPAGKPLESLAKSVEFPKEAERPQWRPAEALREHLRPDGVRGEFNGLASVAKSLEAVQGRVDVAHWAGPSGSQRESAAATALGADSVDHLVRGMERLASSNERLLEALDRRASPASAPLGTSGADRSSVPAALPAKPPAFPGRL